MPQQRLFFQLQFMPGEVSLADRTAFFLEGGAVIQQPELFGAARKPQVFVLPVYFDQVLTQSCQLPEGNGGAVDPGPGAAVVTDNPPQVTVAVLVQLVFRQPGKRGLPVGEFELGGKFRLLRALPNGAGIGPLAAQQAQRTDQDRIAVAGFRGDSGNPVAEFVFE